MNLIVPRLRNIPVLAEEAAHIAARRAHAENARARQKMVQRLFLDGINLQRRRRAISQAVKLAAFIDADETKSSLAGIDVAVARTKIAVNAAVCFRFPPARFVQCIGFLEDFQLRHTSSFPRAYYNAFIRRDFARKFAAKWQNLRRGCAGADTVAAPLPNQRTVPSGCGISTSGERTCSRPGQPLPVREMSRTSSAGTDFSKDSGDNPAPRSNN